MVLVLVLAILLGGGYAAAYYAAGDKLPRGTTVGGVGVGDRTAARAAQVLRQGLRERAHRPITVTVGGRTERVTPREAGLAVDYRASVDRAVQQQSWRLSSMWDHYAGGEELDPVVTVDEVRLDALVARLDAEDGTPPRDGAIAFHRDGPRIRAPRLGEQLDAAETGAALESAYLQDDPRADLTLHQVDPDIDAGDLAKAMTGFANPAMSGSVRLLFGRTPVRLQPSDYAPAIALRAKHGTLVPHLYESVLRRLVGDAVAADGAPVDATVALVDGRPQVVPAKRGVTYHQTDVDDAFLRLVTRDLGRRSLTVRSRVADARFTTGDARRLRIRDKVSSFTTSVPPTARRDTDLGRAAEAVDGTVLKPGETFSLDGTVGERTSTDDGASQLATPLFNAMFFAGLEDVEHTAHASYVDGYPVGRDATAARGSVDLRFRNDTPYGVLIHAHVTPSTPSQQGAVTVSMWSTKRWDITSSTSDRYRLRPPRTLTLTTSDCRPSTGQEGFDVDVTRHFRRPGRTVLDHDEVFHTRYLPTDTVVCG